MAETEIATARARGAAVACDRGRDDALRRRADGWVEAATACARTSAISTALAGDRENVDLRMLDAAAV